ncbi:transcription initiation factor IIB [Haloarchaeobius amylolyticus]|uniref:transcription initiation factor IIB n=1 Tax=Haloarchaeobius amylolyticus TaxID=1198296 RepID=UPI00226F0110|nr:transcription initiation factor IIB family protein [Haloarchaeobius amylolyticus]
MATRHIYASGFDESERLPIDLPCPECNGDLEREQRQTYCTECGLVVREYEIDHGPDWFDGQSQKSNRHVGSPLTPSRHDKGLSSEIAERRDAKGNRLTGRTRRRFSRLRRHHSQARQPTKRSRNRLRGLVDVRRITSTLELPASVRDRAASLFRESQSRGLLPGRSVHSFTAASVYAACRCFDLPRTLQEVESVARCDRSALRNAYRVMNIELGLEVTPPSPSAFIPKLASRFAVSSSTRHQAVQFAQELESAGKAIGKQPVGVAAACLYEASQQTGERLVQTELADEAGVSAPTIRKRRDEIRSLEE